MTKVFGMIPGTWQMLVVESAVGNNSVGRSYKYLDLQGHSGNCLCFSVSL